jgi:hypothetical protein
MNIIILDDYQDAVRKLPCASKLDGLSAKVFTNTVKGVGQLAVRLRDAEALVLIRERTHFPKALLEKLPKLRLISQTGPVGAHIDLEACTRLGIAVAETPSDPVVHRRAHLGAHHVGHAPVAAVHRQPQAWCVAAVRPEVGVDADQLQHGHVLEGQNARDLGLWPRGAAWWRAMARPLACT